MDKNNQVSDYALYSLGLKDQNELKRLEERDGITYNINDIFAVNADKYTYGSYNVNYNESNNTYT